MYEIPRSPLHANHGFSGLRKDSNSYVYLGIYTNVCTYIEYGICRVHLFGEAGIGLMVLNGWWTKSCMAVCSNLNPETCRNLDLVDAELLGGFSK